MILTQIGLNEINSVLGTSDPSVEWKYFAVGDGDGEVPTFTENSTSLINEQARREITNVTRNSNNSAWVEFEGYIPSDIGEMYVREIGIFNTNNELVAVSSYPVTYIPNLEAEEGAVSKALYPIMAVQIANSENVNFTIDNTTVMASQSWVTAKIESEKSSIFQTLEESKTVEKIISSDYVAKNNESLLVDTTAEIVEITLPVAAKDLKVWITDLNSNFKVNKIVMLRNGATIMGIAENMDVEKNNISFLMHCVEVEKNIFDWRIR